MKRPLVLVLFFYIIGVLFGRYFSESIVLFLALIVLSQAAVYLKTKKWLLMLVPFAAFLGFLTVTLSLTPKVVELEAAAAAQQAASVSAIAESVAKTSSGSVSAIVRTKSITVGDKTYKNGIKLFIITNNAKLSPGDVISFEAKLMSLDEERNPGAYNEFQYLRSRKIAYKLYPKSVTVESKTVTIETVFGYLRAKCGEKFAKLLSPEDAGIITALISGQKADISSDDRDLYKSIGIYHILAVSGLHLTIIASVIEAVLSKILRRRHSVIATVTLLCIYCIFTGSGVGAVRAALMYSMVALSSILRRDRDPLTYTSFSALILLLYEPLYLFDMGFQFSFLAVYGIFILTEPFMKFFAVTATKLPFTRVILDRKYFKKYMASVLAATLATYPVTAFYFGTVSLSSLLANLFITPTVFILVIFGLVAAAAPAVVCGIPAVTIGFMLGAYRFFGLILASLPFSELFIGRPEAWAIIGYFGLLLTFAYTMHAKGKLYSNLSYALCIAVPVFITANTVCGFIPGGLRVTMLDVGQGDCTVIEYGAYTAVVDGGGREASLGNSTGVNVLIPYLNYRGINSVDCVFVSHIDADHVVGIIELLEHVVVENVYISYDADQSKTLSLELLDAIAENGAKLYLLRTGDYVMLGDLTVNCLYPFENTSVTNSNDTSNVLKISYKTIDFLLAGDLSSSVEADLIKAGTDLDCEVMKLSHHGSKYSNSSEFLEAVSPMFAFAGAGRNNSYGHPSKVTLDRLSNLGIRLYDTADNGAIVITTNGNNLRVRTMLGENLLNKVNTD